MKTHVKYVIILVGGIALLMLFHMVTVDRVMSKDLPQALSSSWTNADLSTGMYGIGKHFSNISTKIAKMKITSFHTFIKKLTTYGSSDSNEMQRNYTHRKEKSMGKRHPTKLWNNVEENKENIDKTNSLDVWNNWKENKASLDNSDISDVWDSLKENEYNDLKEGITADHDKSEHFQKVDSEKRILYVMEPKFPVCDPESKNIEVVLAITSLIKHFNQREELRNTWLRPTHENKAENIRKVFILAKAEKYNKKEQALLEMENNIHGDILQGDFIDTYRNLTLKTMMILQWFSEQCPLVKHMMKTDDDTFVNTDFLLALLSIMTESETNDKYIMGRCVAGTHPIRDKTIKDGKWAISKDVYPLSLYPPYCHGTGYVMSAKAVHDISKIMWGVPYLPFEDVFIGVSVAYLPYHLNIIDYPSMFHQWYPGWEQNWHIEVARGSPLIVIHPVPYKSLKLLWTMWTDIYPLYAKQKKKTLSLFKGHH